MVLNIVLKPSNDCLEREELTGHDLTTGRCYKASSFQVEFLEKDTHVHMCICVHLCMHVHMCACMCVYVCICACAYAYVCM